MKSKNVLTETKKRLEQIREKRNKETYLVDDKLSKLRDEQAKLQAEQAQASDDMNLGRYSELSEKLSVVNTAINMYETKRTSLTSVIGITSDESDKTIDALISYQDDLGNQFISAIAEPIAKIEKLLANYDAYLADLRSTISTWQAEVNHTYRGSQMIPSFAGCGESIVIRELVTRLRELRKLNNH